MKKIGIKLADGSFYPICEEGQAVKKTLEVTTSQDNQTTVQLDIYRSEKGTMEDAEYVDTVEVKNLTPHPNGEATLKVDLEIDQDNKLSATMVDTETGKKSSADKDLQALSVAAIAEDFNFDQDTSSISQEEMDQVSIIDDPFENTIANDFPVSFDAEKTVMTDSESSDNLTEEKEVITPNKDDKEFSFDDTDIDSTPVMDSADAISEDFDFGETTEKSTDSTSDSVQEATADSEIDLNFEKQTAVHEAATTQENFELPDFEDTENDSGNYVPETETTEIQETSQDDSDLGIAALDLPDFSEKTVTNDDLLSTDGPGSEPADPLFDTTEDSSTDSTFSDSSFTEDQYEVPDFDDNSEDSLSKDYTAASAVGLAGVFDDFDSDPDLNTDSSLSDDLDSFKSSDPTYNPQNDLGFADLYDQETLEGKTASYSDMEGEEKKKTRIPMIICIICAVICIIAVLLILFIIPSKISKAVKSKITKEKQPIITVEDNLQKEEKIPENEISESKTDEKVSEEKTEEEPAQAPVEIIIEPAQVSEPQAQEQAQEDKIVVAETPEAFVPQVPAPKPEPPKDIHYKIKWGDTLWDIADAYYKNPWRYRSIARYNGIKNPNKIISGETILIPAE